MSLYPSPHPSKANMSGGGLLRVLGALLSLVSIILAILGVVFHQSMLSMVFSVFVALFAVRVFMLWLGSGRSSTQPSPTSFASGTPMATPLTPLPAMPFYQQDQRMMTSTSSPSPPPLQPAQLAYATPPPIAQGYMQAAQTASSTSHSPFASYPAQPAYALQASYAQASPPSMQQEAYAQHTLANVPYVPLEQDPLFALDSPSANERCFMLAKKGKPLIECQDRYALHTVNRCYAVADGVAGSFVPGPWARIVAQSFVEHGGKFANKEDFQAWLVACSQQWQTWIEYRWIPTMNALRERNGDWPSDWSDDLRQGAQTTLIGCSLVSNTEYRDAPTSATIFAVGDGECFLFSPNPSGSYDIAETFPFSDPNEFGVRPDTLVTVQRTDLLERAWVQRKTLHVSVFSGDLIVLATDSLAKWLLAQVYQNSNKWLPLITCNSPEEFEQRIRTELHNGQIEDDDLTMLVIPIA